MSHLEPFSPATRLFVELKKATLRGENNEISPFEAELIVELATPEDAPFIQHELAENRVRQSALVTELSPEVYGDSFYMGDEAAGVFASYLEANPVD
jgi:hypothetical protein